MDGCGASKEHTGLTAYNEESVLEYVKKYKYLGFTIDTNLDYQLHRQKLFGPINL